MKRIFTAALFMAAAYMITGCVRNDGTAETGTGRVKVSFSAQSEHIGADSRAIIDDGYESGSYTGSWEDGDAISVVATLNGVAERATFTYDSQTRLFTGYLTAGTGERTYRASYPASDTDGQVPFGRERTQGGNGFNSSFDAMASATIDAGTSEAGVGPDGAELTFNLKHLTAIVAAHLTTSGAAASEPVKAITLTSDSAPVSASALTFGESTATALHTDGQSKHVIALFGESSTATASEAKAFFNIPEGEYGNLTVSVITENHRADITVDRTGKPLTAGKLYYLNRDIAEWTETPAPSAVWIGNESFEPMELTSDMEGLCHLAITVPSKACNLSRVPSTTLTYTFTLSPMLNAGRSFLRPSCSIVSIMFMTYTSCKRRTYRVGILTDIGPSQSLKYNNKNALAVQAFYLNIIL